MLNGRDRATQADSRAQPGGERVGEGLIAAAQAKDVQGILGQTAVLANGRSPDGIERGNTRGAGSPNAVSPPGAAEAKGRVAGAGFLRIWPSVSWSSSSRPTPNGRYSSLMASMYGSR